MTSPRARRPRTLARLVVGLLLGAGLCGCGGSGPKLHPVTGKVLFEGQPADGATVVFHPVNAADSGTPKPSGTAGPDGTFTLTTHPHGPGAPAGEYTVYVLWYPPNSREVDHPKSKVPARYGGPETPLRATVKDGANELEPFRLTK